MKRMIALFLSLLAFSVPALSAHVNVEIDGKALDGAQLINSVTYVPLRTFSESMDASEIFWDSTNLIATVRGDGVVLLAGIGNRYIDGNGRILYSGNKNLVVDGRTYVPIRTVAKAVGGEVSWDAASRTASVKMGDAPIQNGDDFYNKSDLYWLSRVISAESQGEPLIGKIAVGNVVLNRVESEFFPNNVYDVIFDRKGGVQFTPVANGSINNEPTEESVLAAKICLESYKITDRNVLFFLNPSISESTWIPGNRDYVMTIGQHKFYA